MADGPPRSMHISKGWEAPRTTGGRSSQYAAGGAIFFIVGVVVLVLDQATKYLILRCLKPNELFPVFGVMDIHHVHNSGAAFGMLPAGGHFFIAVAVTVLAALAMSWRRIARAGALSTLALGMIGGGTLGNLIDRLRFGYVVDFLDLRWWPVFNLADSAICVGVGLLMWKLLRPGAHSDGNAA